MAKEKEDKPKREHRASYAKDKRYGGYLIRVEGPQSNMFAGREVPVVRKNSTDETMETLTDVVWTGKDNESGKPVTLYRFEQKKTDRSEIQF
jgi:hypothetical protein